MTLAYASAQKHKVRITLELEVFEDFNPHNIQWEKLFKLEPSETVDAYIEEFDYWWLKNSFMPYGKSLQNPTSLQNFLMT